MRFAWKAIIMGGVMTALQNECDMHMHSSFKPLGFKSTCDTRKSSHDTHYIYIIIIIGFSKEGNAIAIITCDSHEAAHQKLRHDILIEPKKHYDDAVGNNDMDNEHGSEWIGKCNESLVDVQAERTITRNFSRILEVARQLVDKCG